MAALPTPLGRVVPFSPLPGKYGFVQIQGVNINVKEWSPNQATNPLPVTNFNSPKDGNLNVHEEDVAGTIKTTFSITGFQDSERVAYRPTAGDTGYGVLGYSAALSFSINFLVTSVSGPCTIDGVSALQFDIKAVGLALMAGRNGNAA